MDTYAHIIMSTPFTALKVKNATKAPSQLKSDICMVVLLEQDEDYMGGWPRAGSGVEQSKRYVVLAKQTLEKLLGMARSLLASLRAAFVHERVYQAKVCHHGHR